MPLMKLTKSVLDAATPCEKDYELRDTITPGFLCKVTPTGRKVFMLAYRTNWGERRKPAIGKFGELTVDEARSIAKDMLAGVRRGEDPSAAKLAMRQAPTVAQLCEQFIEEYSRSRNKPRTVQTYEGLINRHIVPNLGRMKVPEVSRADITAFMCSMSSTPVNANRAVGCLRKMFNMAEVWEYRPDGSNPCRHVPKYPENGKTRLITTDELSRIYAYLDHADAEGLEHPTLTLAIRLQFEFAARMSEILGLRWDWIDYENRRVVWPDSKTGDISKPLSLEAYRLFTTAYRFEGSPYVCPSIFNAAEPMTEHTYYKGWRRILERAGVPHVGTHGIRHRSVTDIANSGVPVKIGMALTAHKTVQMFMRYVHTEDDPIRAAANRVANRRKELIAPEEAKTEPEDCAPVEAPDKNPVAVGETATAVGNYRPFRHRSGTNREIPPGSKRDRKSVQLVGAV